MDDIGWNDVGYHNSALLTPNIVKLAEEGTKLENYYVAPLCTPTRAMLLTGKHVIHLGMQDGIIRDLDRRCLPTTETTIAQELKLKQYTTHAVGKWHLGFYKEECLPNNRGFDSFFGIYSAAADHYTYQVHETWWDLHRNAENVAHEYRGQYSTELYAKEARTIIKNHDVNKPMFLYLAFQAAHKPIQAPDKYIDMYPDIDNPARRVYAAMVTCMDDAIGSVVDQLKESHLWDNTVLIVSTDNGGVHISGNNWPLKGEKATLWEGGVRGVSFVTSSLLADHVKGTSNNHLMHVTDWFPTILHIAGVDNDVIKSKNLYGVNQWDTISKNFMSKRNDVLINMQPDMLAGHYQEPLLKEKQTFDVRVRAAIRVGNWKLLTGSQGLSPDRIAILWLPGAMFVNAL
uniref:Arylsulfatase B-like n=1 Tax=Saccoglossus kowalevskii TaxID=10224 RepID=A0ABM0MT10_SACKO|nr:PREDICTED: arylsulfatase B-like [Saccoglossus kowalevskii]